MVMELAGLKTEEWVTPGGKGWTKGSSETGVDDISARCADSATKLVSY
jgi:hypothetical protein